MFKMDMLRLYTCQSLDRLSGLDKIYFKNSHSDYLTILYQFQRSSKKT
jgi:hypothetical protein